MSAIKDSGLLELLIFIEFGVIVWLLLQNRRLDKEANALNAEANKWAKVARDQHEQIQTMRRIYQGRPLKVVRNPKQEEHSK